MGHRHRNDDTSNVYEHSFSSVPGNWRLASPIRKDKSTKTIYLYNPSNIHFRKLSLLSKSSFFFLSFSLFSYIDYFFNSTESIRLLPNILIYLRKKFNNISSFLFIFLWREFLENQWYIPRESLIASESFEESLRVSIIKTETKLVFDIT